MSSNHKPLPCVIIAAGESRRMGDWKMILPWDGRTIIEQSVLNAQQAGLYVILVTGHKAPQLEDLIRASSEVDRDRLEIVRAADYKKGMFASARAGFAAAAEREAEWCFFALGDMPAFSPEIYTRLADYASAGAAWNTAVPKFRGKKGHPVIIDSNALKFALSLSDDDCMRDVISAFPSLTVPVEDRGILQDVDTPDDYRKLND